MINVLFVGFLRIGEDNATGRTLQNLFDGVEDISVMQYCLNPRLKETPNAYPTVYLTKKESLTNYFLFTKFGGSGTDSDARKTKQSKNIIKNFKQYLSKLVKLVGIFRDSRKIKFSKETLQRISEFKPDVIYTLGGSIADTDVAVRLADYFNIPIVSHAMDDLINRRYTAKGFLNKRMNKKFLTVTEKMYERSISGIAIGEKMANEYEKRFNLPFSYAMNCIEQTHYKPREKTEFLRIIFSGGVHGGRDGTLISFAESINKYNASQPNKTVRLEIYTNNFGIERLSHISNESISVNPYVPAEKMFDNLSRADILLHVESFNEEDRLYFRLSMSTKIPEYLSCGRALLLIGPEDLSSLEYVEKNQVGAVFHNMENIDDYLRTITDESLDEMGSKALLLAEKNHLRPHVQEIITTAFKESVEKYKSNKQ